MVRCQSDGTRQPFQPISEGLPSCYRVSVWTHLERAWRLLRRGGGTQLKPGGWGCGTVDRVGRVERLGRVERVERVLGRFAAGDDGLRAEQRLQVARPMGEAHKHSRAPPPTNEKRAFQVLFLDGLLLNGQFLFFLMVVSPGKAKVKLGKKKRPPWPIAPFLNGLSSVLFLFSLAFMLL